MKKAVVLGASGGMGYSLVQELLTRNIETVAFARNKDKLQRLFGDAKGVTLISGDAFCDEDLNQATAGCDVIFHSVSIPYEKWIGEHPALMKRILNVAKHIHAKVAIVDNIYAYGRSIKNPINEEHPKTPHTKKGRIRLEIETMASKSEVPILFAHFPDFYGPHAENTLLFMTMSKMINNQRPIFVGDPTLKREYIYTPDGAKALIELAQCDDAYNQHWNIPGYGTITGHEIISTVRSLTNCRKKPLFIGKTSLFFGGLVQPFIREFREMFYLCEQPVILDGDKYNRIIGPVPKTPYSTGLKETLASMKTV